MSDKTLYDIKFKELVDEVDRLYDSGVEADEVKIGDRFMDLGRLVYWQNSPDMILKLDNAPDETMVSPAQRRAERLQRHET